MPAIKMTSVIDSVKRFARENANITDEMITDIYICCPKCEYMSSWIGCYINACIIRYADDDSYMVYLATDSDHNLRTFVTETEREKCNQSEEEFREYIYSTVSQKEVVKNIDKSVDHIILRAGPIKDSFVKTVTRYHKPDYRKKQPITWTNEDQLIEYYKLSIYTHD